MVLRLPRPAAVFARPQSGLAALLPTGTAAGEVQATGKVVTAMFLVGWGVGGLIFGALGDRYGRAKMLTLTVLIYSCFTGLTFFSQTWWDFTLFRFLTGLGVGGVFGLSCSLIAETVPDIARAAALGMLQILSTIGNISAALFKILIDYCDQHGIIAPGNGWRWMFLVGALPAILVIFTGKYLREPEAWLRARAAGKLPTGSILQPYADLISDLRWRKNLIVGALIASTGVIGLWAIGEYAVDLQRFIFNKYYRRRSGQSPAEVKELCRPSDYFGLRLPNARRRASACGSSPGSRSRSGDGPPSRSVSPPRSSSRSASTGK